MSPAETAITELARHEVLKRLERLSQLAPEMRFGQLIANLAFIAAGPWDQTLWDLEDEPLLAAIRQMEADLSQRETNLPNAALKVTLPGVR